MTVLRRITYVLAGLVGLLAVVLVTAVIVMQTDGFRDWLRRLAVDRARPYLTGELRIQRLGGSLLHGVDLDGLSLTQDGVTLIAAERITVRYDPMRMWREGLAFEAIDVTRPRIHAVETAAGWNVAYIVKARKTPSSKPASFRIGTLTVTGADITVAPVNARPRRLSSVDIAGRLEQKAGTLTMALDRFSGTDDRTGYHVDSLTGAFDGAFTNVDVRFRASSGESRLAGRVTSGAGLTARRFVGEIDMERIDLARLLERDAWQSDISGHASVEATRASDPQSAWNLAFHFLGSHASAFGYEGQDLDVTGTYADSRVAFAGSADGYGATATADATLVFAAGAPPVFTSTGTFARANLARMPRALSLPAFQTAFAGRYRMTASGPAWSADVTLTPSTFEDAAIGAGTTGHIDVAGGVIRYEGQGTTERLNVRRLSGPLDIAPLGEARFESVLNGTFHVSGTEAKNARHVDADVALHDSTMAGARFPALDLTTTVEGRRIDVRARGDFTGLTEALPDLPQSVPFVLNGRADASLTIHDYDAPFTVESMDVRGRVDLAGSSLRGIDVTTAALDADLVAGIATVRSFTLAAPAGQGTATGTLALGSAGESDLTLEMTSSDLAPLGEILGTPLRGGAELNAHVTGPATNIQASGTLNGHTLSYGTTASALTLNTSFDATLPDHDVDRVMVTARSEGTFIKTGGFEILRATANAKYADKLAAVDGHLEEQSRTLDLAGIVSLGNTGRDIAVQRLDFSTAGTTWTLPAEQAAHVRIGSDRVVVEGLTLASGEQRLDINGTLLTADTARADEEPLTVRARAVQVADINRLLLGTRALTGVLTGDATVRGTLTAPNVEATLTVVDGTVETVHVDAARATVSYANGNAVVDAVLDQTPTNQLRVAGNVPLAAPATDRGTMNLSVTSNAVDLGLVQAFTTAVTKVSGTGTFDVRVTGTMKAPVIDGSLDVADGRFAVEATGVTYTNLDTRLEFEKNRLRIASLQIEDSDHHVARATGGIDLVGGGNGAQTFDIALTADDFHVMNNPFGVVQVDALVRARGDVSAPLLSGTLRIDQGRIEVDRVLETTTKSVYSTKPQDALDSAPAVVASRVSDAATASGSLFSRASLDLTLDMPDNLVLRGRDLRVADSSMGLGDMNIIAGGALSLKKAPGRDLAVNGNMQVIRGYYSFQGRRFNVQRDSEVRFRGQSPIDPALSITADREISGVTATVGVQGSLTSPRIALSSAPPLDEADVLSLIVFGAPVNDLGIGQRNSLSERAASMAAGAIATPVADSVARALNLDLFEIQTQGTNAATVSLGSQIGTRLYVGLKQDIGQAETTALSLEYQLASFVRLVTSIVQNAAEKNAASQNRQQSGVDLMFVFRY